MGVVTKPFRRRAPVYGVIAASVALAVVCAVCSVSTISVLPPRLKLRQLGIGGARTAVLVDFPSSAIDDPLATPETFDVLITRAHLLARLMTTPPALAYVGRDARVSPAEIAAVAPITVPVPSVLSDAGSEVRAHQLVLGADPYRLEAQSRTDAPIIDIYTQAPTPAGAERLANAAIEGLGDYLRALAAKAGFGPATLLRLDQLGPARGGIINPGAALMIAALVFLFAFAVSCATLLVLARLLSARPRPAPRSPEPPPGRYPRPSVGAPATFSPMFRLPGLPEPLAAPGGALALRPSLLQLSVPRFAGQEGDWPRTTRVMPWLLALFMAILWLVPFDSIALKASLPIDMKFDRVVLPFIILTWILSLAVGGTSKPRLRLTKIHVAVGVFVALAFLSVIVNAGSLNRSLELDTSFKQLPLLLAYLSLFFMAASIVRRSEVRPFLTYTLVLALVCAAGMLVEYKTQYNVFFALSTKLLSSIFTVTPSTEGYDSVGRVVTHGPTAEGLAAASILAMALPIAVVRIMHAERFRQRLLYWLAAGLLIAAVLATQKKTGLLAPAAAFLTLACFRPRELRKIVPVALVLLIAVLIISPGTVDPVIRQFTQIDGGAPTMLADRASRYDAIRPDVFTHLALGRGYGSYQPLGHRILDSEILLRLVETGVLGLAAYLLLGFSVIATARASISSRHPRWAQEALAAAPAAMVFLVVGALFDAMSFPQVPYIFLYLAAFVAVLAKAPDQGSASAGEAILARALPRPAQGDEASPTAPSSPGGCSPEPGVLPGGRSTPTTEVVAVVVVTFNSTALLADLTASLEPGCGEVPWHLTVVDNASTDDSLATLRRLAPEATVVEMGRNAGYAAGLNAGVAAAAPHTCVLVLNPDVRLEAGCVPELLRALRTPGTGIAVPRLVDARGVRIDTMRREPSISRALGDALLGARRAGRIPLLGEIVTDERKYTSPNVTDWAEGSTLLISSECWRRCGAWDESFFLYSEETEFALRARDAGFATRYTPTARAVHLGGSVGSARRGALVSVNRIRLFRRRHGLLRTTLYWSILVLRESSRAAIGRRTSRAAVRALLSVRRLRENPGPHNIHLDKSRTAAPEPR